MCERISKKMIIDLKLTHGIGLVKGSGALIAIKMHPCDAKIVAHIPMAHLSHGIFNVLWCGWAEAGETKLGSLYMKIQGALHCVADLMACIVEQGQINFKPATWAFPLPDRSANKADATATLPGATYAISINKWFRFHAPRLHMLQPRCNYSNCNIFHTSAFGGVQWQ